MTRTHETHAPTGLYPFSYLFRFTYLSPCLGGHPVSLPLACFLGRAGVKARSVTAGMQAPR